MGVRATLSRRHRRTNRRSAETTPSAGSHGVGEVQSGDFAPQGAERLAKLIRTPTLYSKRRVEHLTMESVNRFNWSTTQEFVIPRLDSDPEEPPLDLQVVSLGLYDKTRHPDLVATDAGGRQLAVLDRQSRGTILGHAYLAKALQTRDCFGRRVHLSQVEYDALLRVIAQVASLDGNRAEISVQYWISEIAKTKGPLKQIVSNNEFSSDLQHLGNEIHLLVYLPAKPDDNVVVNHSFLEARAGVSLWSDFAGTAPAFVQRLPTRPIRFVVRWLWWTLFGTIRALLRFIGLVPFLIPMANRNAEHVESLHIILDAPDGLTIEDTFWEHLTEYGADANDERIDPLRAAAVRFWRFLRRVFDSDSRAVASEFRRGRTATLSAHEDEIVVGAHRYWFGLQVAPSPLLGTSAVVVATVSLVLALTALVGSGACNGTSPCPNTTGLGIMVALPGIAAGILAQAKSRVTAKIGRGPRSLTLGAAICPYVIAVLLAFGQRTPAQLEPWSRLGAGFAASVSALLLMIWILPRRPFFTRLGREGGNGTYRKRWNRLRQTYAIAGLVLSVGLGIAVYQLIGELNA